jgi:thymidylate kinase
MQETIKTPMKWLQELSKDRIITPDRTFIFVIEPKEALKRIQNRNKLIPFEKVAFLEKVHKNYLKLSNEKRFLKIDATKSVDDIVKICFEDILK